MEKINQLISFYQCALDKLSEYEHRSGECLRLHRNGRQTWYAIAIRQNNGVWKEKYISEKETEKIKSLLLQKYANKTVPRIERILKTLTNEQLLRDITFIEHCSDEFSELYRKYLPEAMLSPKTLASKWQLEDYQRNTFKVEDEQGYQSRKGDIVRSRAELWIADYLYTTQIPYRYECKLVLKDNGAVYPDFTIMDPNTEKLIYLEYFGLMDNSAYRSKALEKINRYALSGITLGNNLIAAFESEACPLKPQAIAASIQAALSHD